MLEFFFEEARTLRRLRSGLMGQHIDGFAEYLRGRQYARWTGRGYLRAVAHLGIWMERGGIAFENLNEQVLKGFVEHLPCCTCLRRNRGIYENARAGTAHFLAYLRAHGVLSTPLPVVRQVPELVTAFEDWMRDYRGVRESTLVTYRTTLLELIASLGPCPAQYDARTIRQFVMALSNHHGRSRAKTVVTAVRMLLRFAAAHSMCSASLADAVPTIAEWRLSSLPQYVLPAVVEQLIASCDLAAVQGIRDRAILLLLARLGLRAGDVAGIRMRDIDWQAATLHLDGKGRREVLLPVPQDVGDAILSYLEHRPAHDEHELVFLGLHAPFAPLQTASAISGVVDIAARRAGVAMPRHGAHVLRHSAATAWVRNGVPLDGVGALLRHRNIETTAHYAKVNVEQLRAVALPWPMEAAPC